MNIRNAYTADLPAIVDCFNAAFGASRTLARATWKLNRYDDGRPLGVLAQDTDGTVKGFYGAMPWSLVYNGQPVDVIQPCDVGIVPSHRGTGLYQELYDFYAKQQPLFQTLAFGFPSAQAASIGMASMGYKAQAETEVYQRNSLPLEYVPAYECADTNFAPGSWFPFLADESAKLGITTHRTKEFLEWRFASACGYLTAYKDGAVVATAIYEVRVGHVVVHDLMATEDNAARELVLYLIDKLPQLPVTYGVTKNGPYSAMLAELGFEIVNRGVLVTSILTNDGKPVSDATREAMRASDRWYCTFTDTDY